MKTKDIALGGVLIALFMAISISMGFASRSIQTIVDVFRIVVVAFYTRKRDVKNILIFVVATMGLSLFLLPITVSVSNVVSCLFLGVLIGKLVKINKIWVAIIFSCVGNVAAFIYSVYSYWLITGINIIDIYTRQYKKILEVGSLLANKELVSMLLKSIDLFVIVVLGIDLFFSSVFSFMFVKLISKRLDRIDNHME